METTVEQAVASSAAEQAPPADAAGQPWGSIKVVLNAPLLDVAHDEWWISILLMFVTLPLNLIRGVCMGLVPTFFVWGSVDSCCVPCIPGWKRWCSAMGCVLNGHPLLLGLAWWRYVIAALVALIANGKSRLALFMWEWQAFGSGQWWWHGEGVWCWSYEDCERILKTEQQRSTALGCVRACCPDMFPRNLLIFLSAGPGTQWEAIRRALHEQFLEAGSDAFGARMSALPKQLEAEWKDACIQDMNDTPRVQRIVSKCVFFVMFGVWVTDAEAGMLAGWRSNASAFVLPRVVQRAMLNSKIRKVKKLRAASVGLVEKYGLQELFVRLNNRLGHWKREHVVELCDEIVFIVGFAGVGGTSAACETVAAFLQCKIPEGSAAKHIGWGAYDTPTKMSEKYREGPENYIKEALRMDPPVTSATNVLREETHVTLKGKEYKMPAGMLNGYALSMANRDPTIFQEPEVFNPDRSNLNKALTWNGALGAADEATFPRICPGRHMSLGITQAILNHALRVPTPDTVV